MATRASVTTFVMEDVLPWPESPATGLDGPLDASVIHDSGVRLDLTVPVVASVSLELRARLRGVPTLPGIELPPRALDVVTVQAGDHTVVRRTVMLPNQRP